MISNSSIRLSRCVDVRVAYRHLYNRPRTLTKQTAPRHRGRARLLHATKIERNSRIHNGYHCEEIDPRIESKVSSPLASRQRSHHCPSFCICCPGAMSVFFAQRLPITTINLNTPSLFLLSLSLFAFATPLSPEESALGAFSPSLAPSWAPTFVFATASSA